MQPHTRTQRIDPTRTQRLGQRPDDSARKTVRRVVTWVLVFVAGVAVWRLDPLDKWHEVSENVGLKHKPHGNAETLAQAIKDNPDCRKYRAAILAQDGRKGDAAEAQIAKSFEEATADHCLKTDDIR